MLGLLALSAVFWIAFATRLSRAKEPLVSLEVLANPIVLAGRFGCSWCRRPMSASRSTCRSIRSPISGCRQRVRHALLGFLLGTVAGATFGGRLTLRVVHAKRIAITGAAIGGVALIAAGLMASEKSLVELELVLTVIGIGMGMTFPVTTVSVQNAVDQPHLGVATGMLTFLRSLGAALGVAVLGAILLAHAIPLGHGAEGRMFHVTDPRPFAVMYYAMAAIMLVATAIYAVMPHKELRAKHEPAPALAE